MSGAAAADAVADVDGVASWLARPDSPNWSREVEGQRVVVAGGQAHRVAPRC